MKPRRTFQFSIAMLLALTALVAVSVWALVSEPTMVTGAVLTMLTPVFPALSITACISTRAYGRAFWVGAAASSIYGAYTVGYYSLPRYSVNARLFEGVNEYRWLFAFMWGNMLPVALLCVAFRWMLLGGSETEGP